MSFSFSSILSKVLPHAKLTMRRGITWRGDRR